MFLFLFFSLYFYNDYETQLVFVIQYDIEDGVVPVFWIDMLFDGTLVLYVDMLNYDMLYIVIPTQSF